MDWYRNIIINNCSILWSFFGKFNKESDDKYVVGVLRTGYKIFEYFNRKKNNLGVYFSYIILWVGYMALNGENLN